MPELKPGDAIAHYTIVSVLGQGGMGSVYRARNTLSGLEVALKFMDEGTPERFQVEAEALGRLRHPGIPELIEYGLQPCQYVAQEIILGVSLEERLKSPLSLSAGVAIGMSLLDVLTVVHDNGFVHRDIKPDNIILRGGHACLIDFGLVRVLGSQAQLTGSGQILGTPEYMAPEQINPSIGPISTRTDLFAVGTILYRMLTGRLPTNPGSYPKIMRQVLDAPPPPPQGLTAELTAVLLKALEKHPDARYQTAREFRQALGAASP